MQRPRHEANFFWGVRFLKLIDLCFIFLYNQAKVITMDQTDRNEKYGHGCEYGMENLDTRGSFMGEKLFTCASLGVGSQEADTARVLTEHETNYADKHGMENLDNFANLEIGGTARTEASDDQTVVNIDFQHAVSLVVTFLYLRCRRGRAPDRPCLDVIQQYGVPIGHPILLDHTCPWALPKGKEENNITSSALISTLEFK